MPRLLSEQLLRSHADRAVAFKTHVQAIRTDNSGAPASFHDALLLVEAYCDRAIEHTGRCWDLFPDDFDRLNEVKAGLEDLNKKEIQIDRIFARTGNASLPRSLARRIANEFARLGLPSQLRPVLTVGAPSNFETWLADLRGYLFHNLWNSDYPRDHRYRQGHFALITVPYLEGTRALWEPLVVGHEVGHVAIHYMGNMHQPGVSTNRYLGDLVERIGLHRNNELALDWTAEILCDLNALRLYGPAAVAALAEMLSVSDSPSTKTSESHPPRALRTELLLLVLDNHFSFGEWSQDLQVPWRELSAEEMSDDPAVQISVETLRDSTDVLWREVCSWGDIYEAEDRRAEIMWLSNRLSRGIPGGLIEEHGRRGELLHPPFQPADVVNAAWLSQERMDRSEMDQAELDRLGLKAMDSLEFAGLWVRAGGFIESEAYCSHGEGESTGLLSGRDIQDRLSAYGESQLIVTPLLGGSIGDAGLDMRLSSSFIVFRHSATAVFDALRGDEDPHNMQEIVEKEWGEPFILHPGELVLAATLEYIVFPLDIAGQLVTRSSYGRLGLITATAIQVQPGSEGVITLELVNLGQTPIALRAGQRIGQLVLHRLANPSRERSSRTYRRPTGPEFSRVVHDKDNSVIAGVQRVLLV